MRLRSALTMLLLAGLGFGLSACYYPAPGYYDSGYYGGAPAYYSAPAYYGPSVGVYYGGGGGWRGGWDRDRRGWH